MTNVEMHVSERQFTLTRLLKAPRELVFDVWTDPKHVAKWWGPDGFTTTVHSMNAKTGGEWRFTMHGPDGTDYPNYVKFLEIIRPSRLVYKHAAEREDEPGQFVSTVTFEARGNETLITMTAVFEVKEEFDRVVREHGAIEGAQQHVGRLEAYVTSLLQTS